MCVCDTQGPLNQPPAVTRGDLDWRLWQALDDSDLCHFACIRGYCPEPCSDYEVSTAGGRWDFSWVTRYAAVGDSFAAGIGIGTLLTDSDASACSRYDGAYPLKVQQEVQAKIFDFTACSGDTSKDIVQTQIAKLSNAPYVSRSSGSY
jgi:hypothetical protein